MTDIQKPSVPVTPATDADGFPLNPYIKGNAQWVAWQEGHEQGRAIRADTPPPLHPDDGHEHRFGCRLCGVDLARLAADTEETP